MSDSLEGDIVLLAALSQAHRWQLAFLLKEESKSLQEIATALDLDEMQIASLHSLVALLTSRGFFHVNFNDMLEHTLRSRRLLPDAADSLVPFLRSLGMWSHLGIQLSVAGGERAQEASNAFLAGMNDHPGAYAEYRQAQIALFDPFAVQVLVRADFSWVRQLVVFAGGHGGVLSALLQKYSALSCILFDSAAALEDAKDTLLRTGGITRCTFVEGDVSDLADANVSQADACLLLERLCLCTDERALGMLRLLRSVSAHLFIVEPLMREDVTAAFLDLQMLVEGKPGQLRTEAEMTALLATSGFEPEHRITVSDSPVALLEYRVKL